MIKISNDKDPERQLRVQSKFIIIIFFFCCQREIMKLIITYKIENTQILVLVGMNCSPHDAQNKDFLIFFFSP